MTPEDLEQRLREAFEEGHKLGYERGGDDRGSWECGPGSKHPAVIDRDRMDDWRDSETRAALYQEGEA